MTASILDGLALVDTTGRLILGTTVATLVLGIGANLVLSARYAGLEADLDENGPRGRFSHAILGDIVREAEQAARVGGEPNVQAIIEDRFQSGLRPLLLAERFVRSSTGLVIILGLLGTFYGLTSSIGRLIHLVAGDSGAVADVTQGVTAGLTQALSGMAVAFSNSLVGIVSAVVLTVLGVFSSPADRRVGLMLRLETHVDRVLVERGNAPGTQATGVERAVQGFGESVARLEEVVARFDASLQSFSASTRDFSEFNAHLKDNVQRMSLSFGDLNDALKGQIASLKREDGR
jgi:hypothetical protein